MSNISKITYGMTPEECYEKILDLSMYPAERINYKEFQAFYREASRIVNKHGVPLIWREDVVAKKYRELRYLYE